MGIYSISSSNAMKTFREKIQEKTKVVLPDNAKNRDYKIVAISNQDANNELLFKQLKMGFKPKLKILNDIDTTGIKTLATIDGGGDNKNGGNDNNNGNDGNVKKSVKVDLDK